MAKMAETGGGGGCYFKRTECDCQDSLSIAMHKQTRYAPKLSVVETFSQL